MNTPIEFLPWSEIPEDKKRITTEGRQVLGETFMGEPTWLPFMGYRHCAYCQTRVVEADVDVWVDETDGDCCWGDPETGDNENEPHVAVKR